MGGMIAPKIPLVALVIDVHEVRKQNVFARQFHNGGSSLVVAGKNCLCTGLLSVTARQNQRQDSSAAKRGFNRLVLS
jgi:hypothetical protein